MQKTNLTRVKKKKKGQRKMKNANKKLKKNRNAENTIEIEKAETKQEAFFRIKKTVFEKLIKANFNTSAGLTVNEILSGIKFEYKDGILKIISTDGNRLLVNEVETMDGTGECSAIYNGGVLGKIKFLKNMCQYFSRYQIDYLEFTMTPENLEIKDFANRITYNVKSIVGQYPNYEKLFPNFEKAKKNTYTQIGINVAYLQELKNLSVNSKTNLITLTIQNNKPLAMIFAESNNAENCTKSKTIIMPIQIR